MLLHTVSASPFSSSRIGDAVRASTKGDAILLLGDAAYAAIAASQPAATIDGSAGITWYVIAEDCQVRGIAAESLHASVAQIDYEKFVELVIAADSTIAW